MVRLGRAGAPAASLTALIVIAVLLLIFLGGDRLAAIGKGLGDGVRSYKRARREPDAVPRTKPAQVVESPPKLLPAKGESSASKKPDDDREP